MTARTSIPIKEVAPLDLVGRFGVVRQPHTSKKAHFVATHATREDAQEEAVRLAIESLSIDSPGLYLVVELLSVVGMRDGVMIDKR